MTARSICFLGLLMLLATTVSTQERFVKPFDEGRLDSTIITFRAKLISAAEKRSPIDYRAGFEKKRGVWKMVTFVAGD